MQLTEALRMIEARRFSLAASRIGTLPPRGAARVLMVDVTGETDLIASLFEKIEHACEPLGFPREKRRFHPHITIGRMRIPRRVSRELESVKFRTDAAV